MENGAYAFEDLKFNEISLPPPAFPSLQSVEKEVEDEQIFKSIRCVVSQLVIAAII